MSAKGSVSVVVPVYNEEQVIVPATTAIVDHLRGRGHSFEVFPVENGSRDATWERVGELERRFPGEVKGLRVGSPGHGDYGLALKTGALAATGEFVVNDEIDIGNFTFYDEAIVYLESHPDIDMVIGSKALAGSNDKRPPLRRFATGVVNVLLRVFLGFRGTDTHGLKVWRRTALEGCLRACVTGKDMFASEFVIRAQRSGIGVAEIPIDIEETRLARVNLFKRVPRVLRNILDMWIIFHVREAKIHWEVSRYVAVAASSVCVNLVAFNALLFLTGIKDGPGMFVVAACSFGIATVNSFIWNKRWVFRHGSATGARSFGTFVAIACAMTLLGSAMTAALITYVRPPLPENLWPSVALLLTIPVTFAGNYLGSKVLVFGRRVRAAGSARPPATLLLAVAACFAVAGFLGGYRLTAWPQTWFDEGVNVQVAANETLYGEYGIRTASGTFAPAVPFVTTGYPVLLPVGAAIDAFGPGLAAARSVMVAFIAALLCAFFVLAWRLHGPLTALASIALLSSFIPLYGQGRNVLGDVPGMAFLGGFLCCVVLLERRDFRGVGTFFLAGVLAGLCVMAKSIFVLLLPALLVCSVLMFRRAGWRWGIVAAAAGFLLPFVAWAVVALPDGASLRSVVGFYGNSGGIDDRFAQAWSNLTLFLRPHPLLFVATLCAWCAGYAVRLMTGVRASVAESVALAFALTVATAFFSTLGYFRYFFPAELLAVAFLPSSLSTLARPFVASDAACARAVAVGCVVLGAAQAVAFVSYLAVAAPLDDLSAVYARYFSTIPPSTDVFVYNVPEAVPFIRGDYAQFIDTSPTPVPAYGRDGLPALERGEPELLVTNVHDWKAFETTLFRSYERILCIPGLTVARSVK